MTERIPKEGGYFVTDLRDMAVFVAVSYSQKLCANNTSSVPSSVYISYFMIGYNDSLLFETQKYSQHKM